jgi:hypothetical protein
MTRAVRASTVTGTRALYSARAALEGPGALYRPQAVNWIMLQVGRQEKQYRGWAGVGTSRGLERKSFSTYASVLFWPDRLSRSLPWHVSPSLLSWFLQLSGQRLVLLAAPAS